MNLRQHEKKIKHTELASMCLATYPWRAQWWCCLALVTACLFGVAPFGLLGGTTLLEACPLSATPGPALALRFLWVTLAECACAACCDGSAACKAFPLLPGRNFCMSDQTQ